MSLFALFYNFILLVVYIILTPYLIYKSKSKKYKIAIPAKFFLKNNPKFEKDIWFEGLGCEFCDSIDKGIELIQNMV